MRHMRMGMVLLAASAAFLAAQDPPGRVGRLNYREGPVSYQPPGINDWVDANVNRPLTIGDNIWVGERGRAEFHIGSTALRLSAYSAFQFLNLDDQIVQIRLSEGTLTVRLRNLAQNQIFEIDTPNLAFTIVRPGQYRIDVNSDSLTTLITVRDGEGEVTGGGEAFPVYARQRVAVTGDQQINYNLAAAGRADDFDQWIAAMNVPQRADQQRLRLDRHDARTKSAERRHAVAGMGTDIEDEITWFNEVPIKRVHPLLWRVRPVIEPQRTKYALKPPRSHHVRTRRSTTARRQSQGVL